MHVFVLAGVPVPQQRPRRGKFIFYNPNAAQKTAARWELKQQFKGHIFKKEAISLDITYYLPTPKTISKKEKEALILENFRPHIKKPDIDNLLKFTLDAMQGIIFDNDSEIYAINAIKKYSENPQTVITLQEFYAA